MGWCGRSPPGGRASSSVFVFELLKGRGRGTLLHRGPSSLALLSKSDEQEVLLFGSIN